MRIRKVDANGDMTFGQGQANYWNNSALGVGQLVSSRLRLWLGQWFLNPSDGTPYLTEVLGKYTDETRDAVIRSRIFATTGVSDIVGYNSQLSRQTRDFTIHATINTIYGEFVYKGSQ